MYQKSKFRDKDDEERRKDRLVSWLRGRMKLSLTSCYFCVLGYLREQDGMASQSPVSRQRTGPPPR